MPDRDDEFDDDWPDDEDDETPVVACPSCGSDVFDDAEWCPSCGDYITQTRSAWANKSWWWMVLGLLGIAAVIWSSLPR
jgi:hypothetical protein